MDVGEAIGNMWAEVGANIRAEALDWATYFPNTLIPGIVGGVTWTNVNTLFEDPQILFIYYYAANNLCCPFYENPAVDAIYEELLATPDLTRRDELLRDAGNIIFDDYALAPHFWLKPTFIINPRVVDNYPTSGLITLRDLEDVVAVTE